MFHTQQYICQVSYTSFSRLFTLHRSSLELDHICIYINQNFSLLYHFFPSIYSLYVLIMAPTRDQSTRFGSHTKKTTTTTTTSHQKPSKLSMESLQRTISDISFELSKEADQIKLQQEAALPPISEVEDAKCECCGMCEECTPEYISRVRDKFSGKLICGLCSEAVKEEMEKNGGKREEALTEHMNACSRFNRFGRTHPVLFQAQAMKEIFKKSCSSRAKSLSPRDLTKGDASKKGGIARSSSCIPAIMKDMYEYSN